MGTKYKSCFAYSDSWTNATAPSKRHILLSGSVIYNVQTYTKRMINKPLRPKFFWLVIVARIVEYGPYRYRSLEQHVCSRQALTQIHKQNGVFWK